MRRTFADLVGTSAPMPARRAAAVMVALARQVDRVEASGSTLAELRADSVILYQDGTVELRSTAVPLDPEDPDAWSSSGTEAAAALGRLYFQLLVGRPPLDRSDAFEPVLTASVGPSGCAMLARSFADTPAQWPTTAQWRAHFEQVAGGLAPPVPPALRRRALRRRVVLVAALVALVVATVLVVLVAAPRWWDDATTTDAAGLLAQRPRDSS